MPYDEISETAFHEVQHALFAFRGMYRDAKEASRRVDVETLETDTPASAIYDFDEQAASVIINGLASYGSYTVHRTLEVESATWSRVDIYEDGYGFDVVAHATSWKSRTHMLSLLLESAILQLTNNVASMERSELELSMAKLSGEKSA